MKLLTVVVPSYNSADYLHRCIDSLTPAGDEVEIIIVDDGSTDATPTIADGYHDRFPSMVRTIHQPNKGHGGAVNTGIQEASGLYIKVLDSDDWFDEDAYFSVLETLRDFSEMRRSVDLLITNYVYEKTDKKHKHVARYRHVVPRNKVITWDQIHRFRDDEYFLMHSLTYRTELLRNSGLKLPEHTFYVDFLYAFNPLPSVQTLYYLDADLYHYFIGRSDQSVNPEVMVTRLDQQLRVNQGMLDAMPEPSEVPASLYRYMVHNYRINCIVISVMSLLAGTPEARAIKSKLWVEMRRKNPRVYHRIRRSTLGRLVNMHGPGKRGVPVAMYRIARKVVGFN